MEKYSESMPSEVASTRTIDDYRQTSDKQHFIQEILRDQESLRNQLRNLLEDVDQYKKKTGKMIDALVIENVNLKHMLSRLTNNQKKLSK